MCRHGLARSSHIPDADTGGRLCRLPIVARNMPSVVLQPGRHQWLCRDIYGRRPGDLLCTSAGKRQVRKEQRLAALSEGIRLDAEHSPGKLSLFRLVRVHSKERIEPGGAVD